TSGNAPFHNDEMAAYNLENHVYISEYKMSDDYLYQFLSSYSVIIVPLIGIFVTYLILNQEKKEDSAKYMWALPYSKIKIFISKTISAFLYAFVVYLLILFIIFVVVGSIKGFSFGQRLITLYANSLFLIKADYAHQYVVMTQGQYNLLLILVNLFTLFISVLLSEFLSLILKNKKLVFVLSLLIVMLPFGIGEILIKTLNHKYLFMLYPFYFIYTMIPYYAKWFIINQRYFAIEVGGSYVTLSNISMNNHLYVKDMNLCLGLFVGIITIFMIILLASFILKRKDLI
ncbi:MAG: ABC transporter permease, partial [Traorella sp.]